MSDLDWHAETMQETLDRIAKQLGVFVGPAPGQLVVTKAMYDRMVANVIRHRNEQQRKESK